MLYLRYHPGFGYWLSNVTKNWLFVEAGQKVYFRAGKAELVDKMPSYYATWNEALAAATAMGYSVEDLTSDESVSGISGGKGQENGE